MEEWLTYSIITILFWTVWSFLPKIATRYIDSRNVILYEALGSAAVGMVVLFLLNFKPQTNLKGALLAFAAGFLGLLGTLYFVYAITKGKTSVVVAATSLYPVLTIGLAFLILKETITLKQGLGIIAAIAAILLLSS